MPNFKEINPEKHANLYVGRAADEEVILSEIKESFASYKDGTIAICGTPGCGKSTLTKFIAHRINNDKKINYSAQRVDLNIYASQGVDESAGLGVSAYLSFFSRLESILRQYSGKLPSSTKTNIDANRNYDRFSGMNTKDNQKDFQELKFLVTEDLIKIAESIDRKIVIFCDNIDYLSSVDLYLFVEVFGELTKVNDCIRCVFTARPVATVALKYAFREHVGLHIDRNHHLRDLDIHAILRTRFAGSGFEYDKLITNEAVEMLRKLACGNIELALDAARQIYQSRETDLNLSTESDMLAFAETHDLIADIFKLSHPKAMLPFVFVVLLSLPSKQLIEEGYFEKFVEVSRSLRQDTVEDIRPERINSLLAASINMYLVRRVELDSLEDIEAVFNKRLETSNTVCALTERGLTLLQNAPFLAKLSTQFSSYPSVVQKNVLAADVRHHQFVSDAPKG